MSLLRDISKTLTQHAVTKILISLYYFTFILLYLVFIVGRGLAFIELLSLTDILENKNLSVWMQKAIPT